MARRASLVATVAILSGLTVAGAALARQNSTFQPPAAPLAPQAQPAPTAPVAPGDARPAQPIQVTPAVANPNPPASPKPAAPKPAATVKPPEPTKRGRYSVAILQALDKVTTETMRFEVPVGQPIRYKTLIFTVRACETAASDEIAPETSAYVVIDTQPKAQAGRAAPPGRQIYKGWMYASTPGLHPLEHPVYDAWLIACKQSLPDAPPAKP